MVVLRTEDASSSVAFHALFNAGFLAQYAK